MISINLIRISFLILLTTLTACGGSNIGAVESVSNNAPVTPVQTLSVQESQRYFPLSDGNLWASHETYSVNGSVRTSFDRVSQRNGTKLISGLVASVMSVSEIPTNSIYENYLQNDSTGITVLGTNNNNVNPQINNYTPYRLISFPIQIGVTVRQLDKKMVDYGFDFDGDGINDKIDVTVDVVADGYETITTSAGTFENCLRVITSQTEILTLSATGNKISAVSAETTWYAQDIGQVKQITKTFGNGFANQIIEELTGYIVDGRSNKLSLQINPQAVTISAGSTVQLTVTLINSDNNVVMSIPAKWTSSNTAVAIVESNGMVTGVKPGIAVITPLVGGVTGPQVTLNVLLGMQQGLNYPVPSSAPFFYGGNTAIGDLNGDGRNDVAVMESYNSRYRILTYFQNSNDTFDTAQVITTSLKLSGIAIRDINNDGFADLIVSGTTITPNPTWVGKIFIYKQNSNSHTLEPPVEITTSSNYIASFEIADLNDDGIQDIVASCSGNSGNGVLSFFFQGTIGSFGPERIYTSVMTGAEMHVADMNGDGLNDIVVKSGAEQLAVIKQSSPGIFSTSPEYYTVPSRASYFSFNSFALGDLNGDGLTDIAVVDFGNSAFLNVFLQNGSGTLSDPTTRSVFFNTLDEIKIADIDGDGLNDLLVYSSGWDVAILLQSSNHVFQADPQVFRLPTKSYGGTTVRQALSVQDVTGDGLPDIVTAWMGEGIYVLPRR